MSELSTEHANPTSPEVRESPRVKVYERPVRLQRWFLPALLPASLLLAALIALLILVLA